MDRGESVGASASPRYAEPLAPAVTPPLTQEHGQVQVSLHASILAPPATPPLAQEHVPALTEEQVAEFFDLGYLVLPACLPPDWQ